MQQIVPPVRPFEIHQMRRSDSRNNYSENLEDQLGNEGHIDVKLTQPQKSSDKMRRSPLLNSDNASAVSLISQDFSDNVKYQMTMIKKQ